MCTNALSVFKTVLNENQGLKLMNEKETNYSSEIQFKAFMSRYNQIEDLDALAELAPDGIKIADYTIRDLLVIELKTLKTDPAQKMNEYCHKIMERSDFPAIYGEFDFRKAVGLLPDGEKIMTQIETIAFRQIESIISKANKQIKSTIQYLNIDYRTYGTLIIINELADFFEPDVLVDYIKRKLVSRTNGELRFSNIHQVILFQGTHKLKSSQNDGVMLPVYRIENDTLEVTEICVKADEFLAQMAKDYSVFNGFNHQVFDDFDLVMDIEKLKKEPDKTLNGQERIEKNYRHNRYMKDFTEEELIEFGSKVVSVMIATGLRDKPLKLEENQKRHFFKAFIELIEESRLRPFDLRKLHVDPNIMF